MIYRTIIPSLITHLDKQEITLITGPRQSGKTTAMQILMQELDKRGAPYMYLNLDKENDFRLLDTQQRLLDYITLTLGTETCGYVFLDEIQRKEDAGLFIKGLYDSDLPIKFVLSGSGSVELKEKVSEGLAGRKRTFRLPPLTFSEFIDYKTGYTYSRRLQEYLRLGKEEDSLLHEYLQFGGYPRLVQSETVEDKRVVIESIYESFVDKDIKELLKIENTFVIADMLAFLSIRIGQLTPIGEVTDKINIHFETAKKYLYYLEKTYIIQTVRPYFQNPEKELTKTPMYYFTDLGMRNYVFNRMQHYDPLVSGSMLFQNFVYLLLQQVYPDGEIRYWRTKDQAEVDFIVKTGTVLLPVEVKFSQSTSDTLSRSFFSFLDRYEPEEALVVTLSHMGTRQVGKTQVRFVPYYWLVEKNEMNPSEVDAKGGKMKEL